MQTDAARSRGAPVAHNKVSRAHDVGVFDRSSGSTSTHMRRMFAHSRVSAWKSRNQLAVHVRVVVAISILHCTRRRDYASVRAYAVTKQR